MKIYLNKLNESWVVDRFRDEWYQYNKNISSKFLTQADIAWIISPWVWNEKNFKKLKNKKIIYSVYHLEDDFKNKQQISKFKEIDKKINAYHVISLKTKSELENYTDKQIFYAPFWVNQNTFYDIPDKGILKEKFNIPKERFLIGSFQRDSEGSNVMLPKLIKGPDRLVEIYKKLSLERDIHIILSGKRRDYIINKLNEIKVEFTYFEMASFETLNELYNILDLYIVASRIEGGPQAILECAVTKTPIISTDVGIASEILDKQSIFDMSNFENATPNIESAFEKSKKFFIPEGFKSFIKMFELII